MVEKANICQLLNALKNPEASLAAWSLQDHLNLIHSINTKQTATFLSNVLVLTKLINTADLLKGFKD